MSADSLFEHPNPETVGNGFLEDLCVAYGDDGAYNIGKILVDAAEYARQTLPLTERDQTQLLLSVMNPPGGHNRGGAVHAWSAAAENKIAFMINPTASVPDIIESLYTVVPHEFGHIAHHQQNPYFGGEALHVGKYALFSFAIAEGIACAASYIDQDVQERERQRAAYSSYRTSLHSELEELLHVAGGNEEDRLNFLYGNIDLFPRPYDIGHYVVSSMALVYELDLQALMKAPIAAFVKFAQSELL